MSRVFQMTSLTVALVLLEILAIVIIVPQAEAIASGSHGFFVFGDSLDDSGNNFLATSTHCDFSHYDIDYSTHIPTDRFSDGLNFPDVISEVILSIWTRGDNWDYQPAHVSMLSKFQHNGQPILILPTLLVSDVPYDADPKTNE